METCFLIKANQISSERQERAIGSISIKEFKYLARRVVIYTPKLNTDEHYLVESRFTE